MTFLSRPSPGLEELEEEVKTGEESKVLLPESSVPGPRYHPSPWHLSSFALGLLLLLDFLSTSLKVSEVSKEEQSTGRWERLSKQLQHAAIALGPADTSWTDPELAMKRFKWLEHAATQRRRHELLASLPKQQETFRYTSQHGLQTDRRLHAHGHAHGPRGGSRYKSYAHAWYPEKKIKKEEGEDWIDPDFEDPNEDIKKAKAGSMAWKFSGATCGTSLENTLQSIGQAGICADTVRFHCDKNKSGYDYYNCNSNIAGIVSNLLWAGSFIAALPEYCNRSTFEGEDCASDMLWFFGDAAELAMDSISLQSSCNGTDKANNTDDDKGRLLGDENEQKVSNRARPWSPPKMFAGTFRKFKAAYQKHRRHLSNVRGAANGHTSRVLPSLPQVSVSPGVLPEGGNEKRDRELDIANCYFSVENLLASIVDTVLDIWVSVVACGKLANPDFDPAKDEDGGDDKDPHEDKRICAADVLGSTSDIMSLVNLAANIANNCPVETPKYTGCVADTSDLSASIVGIGAWGAAIKEDCENGTWHDQLLTPFAGR
eukprot:TRINITY_DN11410_c0_g1_i3.p1 TRINITY_DN11410_c0_g1~~TRINITY_DN11410_c0_g1_i3.p1  ORF type:complete len:543 (+),score=78.81 TRINITY_DN11410_c0_g1_i3:116-1744(+)